MVEARWNGTLIASSDDTVVVEGNHYFPADAVDAALLRPSKTTTFCPWKGTAHYHSLHVDGADNRLGFVNVADHGNDRCLEAMIERFGADIALKTRDRAMAA